MTKQQLLALLCEAVKLGGNTWQSVSEIMAEIERTNRVGDLELPVLGEWVSVDDELPPAGDKVLFYRPLAEKSNDEKIAVKRATSFDNFCWDSTVPEGKLKMNYSDGNCHTTHWMPLPQPPEGV